MIHRIAVSLSLLAMPIATAFAAETAIETPRLSSIDNFRDIAGTTRVYSTSHEGTMRTGVFYRSNALTPSTADLATLNSLNITNVYDLRTPSEIAATPDTLPDGASYQNIDIIGSGTSGSDVTSVSVTSAAEAMQMMQAANASFVNDAGMRSQFNVLFNELASAEGAALFHCTAGKDRTGWTAAILLSIAGVDSDTIMENYLATNDYTQARVAATLAAMPASMAAIYAPMLTVDASFLQAGLDEITSLYGTVDNYLKEGLGLSQETLYVLRGKMVEYAILPGQSGLAGNAAQGAALLNALQNSELSGHYTAYNFYLQSAIDAGTLGGVEATVGGQVHADAASYLLRQNAVLDGALAPNIDSSSLKDGQAKLWASGLAGYLGTDSSSQAASSNEHTSGSLIGMTQRFSGQLSGYGTFGYSDGSIGGAGGDVDANVTLLGLGARLGFTSLEAGPFVSADLNAGWVDYSSKRELGGGLGTARGDTHGQILGGTLRLGYVQTTDGLSLEPSIGARVAHLNLDGFKEKGSELALDVDSINETTTSALADLKLAFHPAQMAGWGITPAINLGYERYFSAPSVDSQGQVLGYSVEQSSAFDDRNLVKAGASLVATQGAFSVGVQAQALHGGDSHGLNGNLSASYTF